MRGQVEIDRLAPRALDAIGVDDIDRAPLGGARRDVDEVAAVVLDEVRRPDRADGLGQRRADRLPVHQVARVPDDEARIGVERRERHVVVVAVLQDRRVGMVAGEDRIEEGAVAEIGVALALDALPQRMSDRSVRRREARRLVLSGSHGNHRPRCSSSTTTTMISARHAASFFSSNCPQSAGSVAGWQSGRGGAG